MYWPMPASGSPDFISARSASDHSTGRTIPEQNPYSGGAIEPPHEEASAYEREVYSGLASP
jgi:hypothetical protein